MMWQHSLYHLDIMQGKAYVLWIFDSTAALSAIVDLDEIFVTVIFET